MRDERSEDDTDMSERDALKKSRRVKWALAVAGVCVVAVAVVMMARPQPPEKLYAKAMALREAQGTGGGGEMLNILRLLSEAAAAGHTDAQYQLYRLSKILSETLTAGRPAWRRCSLDRYLKIAIGARAWPFRPSRSPVSIRQSF